MREIRKNRPAEDSVTQPSDTRPLFEWRLIDLFESRSFQRRAGVIDALAAQGAIGREWVPTIKAILLIEMRERPAPIRLVEWVLDSFPLKRSPRFTKGPFQMRAAPFRFEGAVVEAQRRLIKGTAEPLKARHDLRQLAEQWNGTGMRLEGAAISYSEALSMADTVLSRWSNTILTRS